MNPGSPVSNQICMSALSLLIIEKLLFSIRVFFRWPTKMGWVGEATGQCLLFPPMLKSTCKWERTKTAMGKKHKPQPLSKLCQSCRKKATRPGKTILKVNIQRTCTLHALLPFFQPLGNRNPMFLYTGKAGKLPERQNILLPDALFFILTQLFFSSLDKVKINSLWGELQASKLDWHINCRAVGGGESGEKETAGCS